MDQLHSGRMTYLIRCIWIFISLKGSFGYECFVHGPGLNSYYIYCSSSCCGDNFYRYCCTPSISVGVIVGIVIAAVILFAIVLAIIIFKYKQNRSRRTTRPVTIQVQRGHPQQAYPAPTHGPMPPPYDGNIGNPNPVPTGNMYPPPNNIYPPPSTMFASHNNAYPPPGCVNPLPPAYTPSNCGQLPPKY